jgi:cyclopropane-fatty-acyl-phospholipid synthase
MLKAKLEKLIRIGKLEIMMPNGTSLVLAGRPYGPRHRPLDVKVKLRGRLTPLKLVIDADRFLGEAYTNGDLTIEKGDLWDLLELIGYNFQDIGPEKVSRARRWADAVLRSIHQRNGLRSSRNNVAHHYDLSEDLYRLFLDKDMQYSCAYFRSPSDTLEQAQLAKKEHIAAKLVLKPGMSVLDIGCGWGGMALFLAQEYRVKVLGITLSKEQLAVARSRAKAMGLEDRVRFELIDYRNVTETFDRIVSVGMFEHVGTPNYDTYFSTVYDRLKPDGVAVIHSIGRMHGPSTTSGFIRRFIFPGGYIPALSEVTGPIERSGLFLTDLEVLRLHYAETLRHWRERFMANLGKLPAQYDRRFQRMWEYYLAASEMSFRFNGFMVFQAQLSRSLETVPLTRDYISEKELLLAAAE